MNSVTISLRTIGITAYAMLAIVACLLGYIVNRQAMEIDAQKHEIKNLCIAGRFDCQE